MDTIQWILFDRLCLVCRLEVWAEWKLKTECLFVWRFEIVRRLKTLSRDSRLDTLGNGAITWTVWTMFENFWIYVMRPNASIQREEFFDLHPDRTCSNVHTSSVQEQAFHLHNMQMRPCTSGFSWKCSFFTSVFSDFWPSRLNAIFSWWSSHSRTRQLCSTFAWPRWQNGQNDIIRVTLQN